MVDANMGNRACRAALLSVLIVALLVTFTCPLGSGVARARVAGSVASYEEEGPAAVPGEIIVKPKPGTNLRLSLARLQTRQDLHVEVEIEEVLPTGARVLKVDDPGRTGEVLEALRRSGDYAYVQPNYLYRPAELASDPFFPYQWALHNVGQVVGGQAGLPDTDLNAPEAWDVTKGSQNVVVAVIDTGVDVNHPDLRGAL